MSQKILISIFLTFFLTSVVFLFWQNERGLDPNYNKDWWTLAFTNPQKSDDLSFVVENFSDNIDFRYEVIRNKETLAQDSFRLKRGEKKTISLLVTAYSDVRTFIIVESGKEKKEIYR